MESSSAEFGSRGFEPSHFKIVPSSSGMGRNVKVDIAMLPFVCCVTYGMKKKWNSERKKENEMNRIWKLLGLLS